MGVIYTTPYSGLVARIGCAMGLRVAYCLTLVHAVVVRHMLIIGATLAPFAGTVTNVRHMLYHRVYRPPRASLHLCKALLSNGSAGGSAIAEGSGYEIGSHCLSLLLLFIFLSLDYQTEPKKSRDKMDIRRLFLWGTSQLLKCVRSMINRTYGSNRGSYKSKKY